MPHVPSASSFTLTFRHRARELIYRTCLHPPWHKDGASVLKFLEQGLFEHGFDLRRDPDRGVVDVTDEGRSEHYLARRPCQGDEEGVRFLLCRMFRPCFLCRRCPHFASEHWPAVLSP